MADQENSEAGAAGQQPTLGNGKVPSLNVIGQYIKDLSFENPAVPGSLVAANQNPQIAIQVNVAAKRFGNGDFEVNLQLQAKAETDGKAIFQVELDYAGLFRIQNVPEENLGPVVLIECPRLLFPFARQVISEVSRNGGYPPLMIDPVDFAALYRQQQVENAGAAAGDGGVAQAG